MVLNHVSLKFVKAVARLDLLFVDEYITSYCSHTDSGKCVTTAIDETGKGKTGVCHDGLTSCFSS